MSHPIYQFESLLTARSHNCLENSISKLTDHFGYDCLFYSPLIPIKNDTAFHDENVVQADRLNTKSIYTTFPESWLIRYQQADFVKRDPVVATALQSTLPIRWRSFTDSKARFEVFNESREHGLSSGISIPVHGIDGAKALLSIVSSRSPEKMRKHEEIMLSQIHTATFYMHEAVNRLNGLTQCKSKELPKLSHRENESLLWAAQGKTAWEIAKILGISENTVIFHLNNAKRKLGATNRQQAIATAISLRIIQP